MKLVNADGSVDGCIDAAYLWQLMRYNILQLLKKLKLHGRDVSDADILHWANVKVKNVGKSTRMESFKVRMLLLLGHLRVYIEYMLGVEFLNFQIMYYEHGSY